MLTPAEPTAGTFGLLADSSRRLLAARRSFRFMSRQLVEAVRSLCGHQHVDVMILVQPGDLALEHAGSFGSNDWIGETMKLGHEPPALAIKISIRDRHIEATFSRLATARPDHDVGISACTAIAVHGHPFANHGKRRVERVLIRVSVDCG